MDRTITIDPFDTKSIAKAIRELERFKSDYEKKVKEYKEKLVEECVNFAQINTDSCWYDDYVDVGEATYAFSKRSLNCYFYTEEKDGMYVITGTGDFSPYDGSTNLVWVEFGAGMYYNGNIGNNPNPLWEGTGLKAIGEYGYRQGRFPVWSAPYGLSHGTQAQMPMYNACIQTEQIAEELAKEVFK